MLKSYPSFSEIFDHIHSDLFKFHLQTGRAPLGASAGRAVSIGYFGTFCWFSLAGRWVGETGRLVIVTCSSAGRVGVSTTDPADIYVIHMSLTQS